MKLSQFLQYLIDAKKYRLIDLAGLAKINISDLSKIVTGKRLCGARNIGQILSALDEEHRAQALVLWLIGMVPEGFQDLVHIIKKGGRSKVAEKKKEPDLKTIEGALTVLGKSAETNAALRIVLLNMAEAFDQR